MEKCSTVINLYMNKRGLSILLVQLEYFYEFYEIVVASRLYYFFSFYW